MSFMALGEEFDVYYITYIPHHFHFRRKFGILGPAVFDIEDRNLP